MDFTRPDLARRAYTELLSGVEDGWNENRLSRTVTHLMAKDAEIANALDENLQEVNPEIVNSLRCAYMNMGAGMAAMRELRGNYGT